MLFLSDVTLPNCGSIILLFLVEFFAPWCQTCQEFGPNFEAAARSLQQMGVVCAKVQLIKCCHKLIR